MRRVLFLLLLALSLSACQRPPMARPTLFTSANVNALADEPQAEASPSRSIFYVTDRVGQGDARAFHYGRQRSDHLEVGQLNIRFGSASTTWPNIAAAISGQGGQPLPRPQLTSIQRFGKLTAPTPGPAPTGNSQSNAAAAPNPSAEQFVTKLNQAIQRSTGKAITIYIHGFNNSFEEAALTTAEYELLTGGLGPFIVYSWPSYNSLFEYSHDRDSVRYTASHARQFVEFLASEIANKRLDAKQIHFIAHSSGAEVIGSILRELALISREDDAMIRAKTWRIGQVLLISPDVSADVARERLLKEDLQGICQRIVIYASSRDRALRWASNVLYRTIRIGTIREHQLTDADRDWLKNRDFFEIVDADSAPYTGLVRHSHHRHSPLVASDIILNLRFSLPPDKRALVRDEGQILWQFAKDYRQRITEVATKAYQSETVQP